MEKIFKKMTGHRPYDYQKEAMECLISRKSLIVRAPTGSGKTEIALIPFIYGVNDSLPPQLIYSLPTRALVESIGKRAIKYASFKKLRVAAHHGKKPMSNLFEEDIIVATIDQTAGAYLSTPLSMPKRWGNIFVGGVASSLTIFDEIHTLHPERGLQTAIAIAKYSARLGFPFVLMSATLPDNFIKKLKEKIENDGSKVAIIDVNDESEIRPRKNRQVELIDRTRQELTVDAVLKEVEKHEKIIIIVNTVERAQKLHTELKKKIKKLPVILLHSRFLEEDRLKKEQLLEGIFGKNSKNEGIFISTQVIEVGMDISSPIILSEIAPVDALIQRAGRCARWGGKGEFYVFGLSKNSNNPYAPYSKKLIEDTIREIRKRGNFILDWNTEIDLTNKVLSKTFEQYLHPSLFYSILGRLSKAVYEGNRAKVEENIRETFSCDVTLHRNPESLDPKDILKMPKIRINSFILRSKLAQSDIEVYKLDENYMIDDYESRYILKPIKDKEEIIPFGFYILKGAYYSPETGLVFDKNVPNITDSFEPIILNSNNTKNYEEHKLKKETWVDHARKTLYILDQYMLPRYRYSIEKFAEFFGYDYNEFTNLIRCIVALHDLGKLNVYWQEKVGWKEEEVPLAHSSSNIKKLPPHATVSARALQPYLEELFGDKKIFKAFYLAIAHHHTPWAKEFRDYKLIPHFSDFIKDVWDIPKELIKSEDIAGRLDFTYLDLAEENEAYRLYGLLSKLLRISDRIATGGENYESIFST